MKTPTSFYVFEENANEWQEATIEELAAENEPDIMIIPIYPDGTQGKQTTWGVWADARQRAIAGEAKKQEMERPVIPSNPQNQAAPAQNPKEKQLGELERLALLPEEIRAVDYLMRNTQLTGMISEAKTFFQKATDLITLVLVINIIAIALLGIGFIFSLGR